MADRVDREASKRSKASRDNQRLTNPDWANPHPNSAMAKLFDGEYLLDGDPYLDPREIHERCNQYYRDHKDLIDGLVNEARYGISSDGLRRGEDDDD